MSSLWTKENYDYERSCIVTCALSGVVANRDQCPFIPYTPEEYAKEARRAYEAGANIVHIHARRPDGTPSYEVEDYKNIYDAITAECPVLINFSTGAIGIPLEKKIAHFASLRPEIAALNMGSMNYAKYNPQKKRFVFDYVFQNPFSEIITLLEAMNKAGVKPEMECFDSGHVGNSYPLIDMGILSPPYQFSLIMGVLGGISPTVPNLVHMVSLLPPKSEWQVIGISLDQWRMVAAAIALGGNVRVGLEDNFYLEPDLMARSNGELVEKAVRMVKDQGRKIADLEETKKRLNLRERGVS